MVTTRPTRRIRTDWEVIAISACITAVAIVVAVCIIVLAVYGAMFGAATMRAHWPS